MGCVVTNSVQENEINQSSVDQAVSSEPDMQGCSNSNLHLRKNISQSGRLHEINFRNQESGFYVNGMSPICYLSNGDQDEIVGYQKSILKDSTKEDDSSKELIYNKSSRKVKFQRLEQITYTKNPKYAAGKKKIKGSQTVTMKMLESIF